MHNDFFYYHQDQHVNDKHVQSLVRFYESGCAPREQYGIGVEIEHIPVRYGTNESVTYDEPHGIRDVLNDLAPLYDSAMEYHDGTSLLGLGREKIAISLESGGQVECSLGIMKSPDELYDLYTQFRADIDPILAKHLIHLINYGYAPVCSARDIRIIPKHRYAVMNEFFGRLSGYGWNMMRGSASTQVSFDFSSETDAITKMRLAVAAGPILGYFFRNTPFFEGKLNELPLLRQHMWESIGTGRAGINTGLYDEDYSFEKAAIDALATPLMAADTTHTPDVQHQGVWTASFENAADVYPDRELNEYEINHIISTHFTDVRLKNFIEMRHWDSLPIERAQLLTDIVVNLFTNPRELSRLNDELGGVRVIDVQDAKVQLQAHGSNALPYGKSLDFWREFLRAEYTGEDIPGDSENPGIFQN